MHTRSPLRDVLINSLSREVASLQAEALRWRGARGVLDRHWEKRERRRGLLQAQADQRERLAAVKAALVVPK